jgi:hypothetical protein
MSRSFSSSIDIEDTGAAGEAEMTRTASPAAPFDSRCGLIHEFSDWSRNVALTSTTWHDKSSEAIDFYIHDQVERDFHIPMYHMLE